MLATNGGELEDGQWTGRQAGSGSGLDNLQTLDDPFPSAQSCGVWEVHWVMIVGPDPEQRVQCNVVETCPNGEPAEL